MRSATRIAEARAILDWSRMRGRIIGLVPTMGNIHAGHLALLERCRQECDFAVATIFVNPLQFGPAEDFADYPRTLEQDRELLAANGCDLLLHPSVAEVYGDNPECSTQVRVPGLSGRLCGASRPGHFDGVATVVTRLLNYAGADVAYFGLKDYQQFLIIRKLAADLGMATRIAGVETVREPDGLALSSRNGYLSHTERAAAPALYRVLREMARRIETGARDFESIAAAGRRELAAAGFRIDYLEIRNADSLDPATAEQSNLIILAAAHLGRTRLIDNLRIDAGGA
ncbi:MAG: pantoate--beta-alanine ligase [Gammaproteobacteria bacterium]|nr:pantoate--beta-alanine ligase [Gammaproteobacteria bacterium]